MAKNQNFEFEDFDFDDFGAEGNDGGFNGVEPKDDRKPVTKIMGGFVEGASNFVTDPSNQVRFIKQALPPGYSQAIGSVEKSISNAKSLYDTALREAAPAIKEAKKITKVLLPSVKGVLPKSLADKMETWIEDNGSSNSDFNPEENEITMSLGSIFAAYQEANKEQTEKSAAEQAARDYALAKQTGDSIKQLVGIHNYTGRLVAYQDQITSKYQQKSLELQYRQFFTAKKSLEVLTQHLELSKTSYDILVKNTALPELVKMHNSEIAKDMMKRKFLGKVTEPLSQWYSGIGQRVMLKARKDITTFFKDLGTNLGDFSSMISDADEQLRDVGGGNLGDLGMELAGQSAGGAVAGKMSDRVANMIRKRFGDTTRVKALGQFFERIHLEVPERAKKFLEEKAGAGGITGWLAEAAGKYQKSTVLQENTSKDLEQKMYFDFQTRQTIVEVIPKWLSKIHRTLEQHRNQDHTKGYNPDKQLEEMWDWEESRIVTRDYAKKKLSDRLMEKTDAQRTNKDARKVMEFFDKGETDDVTGVTTYGLSADVRRQLFKHLIQKAERGELADLEIMVSPAALANPKLIGLTTVKEVEELQKFIKTESKFGYDKRFDNENAWNQEGTRVKSSYSKSLGLSGPFRESKQRQLLELTRRQVNVQRNMKDKMGQMLEEIGKSTEATQLLQELGFAKREGDTYHYNLDKFLEQIYNYDDADTPRFRASGGTLTEGDNPFKSLFQGFKGGGKPQKPRRIKGQVRGPGTTTSDSIPAYVSDKEFIVRAESVGLPGVLPLLQFINSLGNKPDMAPHQLVGAGADSSTASIRMEQMITNNWQTTNDTLKEVLTTMQEMGTRPIFTVNLPDLPNFDLSTIDFNKIKLSLGEAGVLKLYNSGKNLLAAGGKAGIDFAKWTGRNAWELGKGAFGVGKGLLAAGGGAIKSLWSEAEGFYVSGKNRLLLSLKDLEIEDYIDVNTQKVIKKLSDITGEVRDTAGRVIITAEDYAKGIYYGKGRQVITWLSEARDTAWKGIKGVWNLAAIVPNTIKSSYTFMVDVLEAPDDVYVEGDDPWEPRLRAHQFKQNYYRIKATGEPVRRVSQLVEPIVDLKGNVIIDEDDLKRGLVDFNHQPIKGLRQRLRDFGVNSFEKALNIGKKIATTTQDIMFNLFGNIKNFFTGSSWGISLFSSTQTVVTRLEQIWHLLNNRLKGKKQSTPTDFGNHAKITITPNEMMSEETKSQLKQTAQMVKEGVKSAAQQAVDKANSSAAVQQARTWLDDAKESLARRKQEWADNNAYQDYLERTSAENPVREDELTEQGTTPTANNQTSFDKFKQILNSEARSQFLEDSKANVLGYLKSKSLYTTLFENENLTETARASIMERIEKVKTSLPNLETLPQEVKAKLQKLSTLVDEEGRPQSVKRYLDYAEEVAKKYGNKAKDKSKGFGGWFKGLFSSDKEETPQQPTQPRTARSSDMEALVEAQQAANIETSENNTKSGNNERRSSGSLLGAIQDWDARGRPELGFFDLIRIAISDQKKLRELRQSSDNSSRKKGFFKSLFGKSETTTNNPNDFVGPMPQQFMIDADLPLEPTTRKLWRKLLSGYNNASTNLAQDRTKIADAFRNSSGLHDWGKGSFKENAKGFFNWDMENIFRTKESMDKIRQKKEEKLESKRQQKEWDTQYFQIYTQYQSGEISKDALDAWLQRNPSPEQVKQQAIEDAKIAKAAAKQQAKEEKKQAKANYDRDQKEWEQKHQALYAKVQLGIVSNQEYQTWLANNPSPKQQRKESLSKLSFKQRMGKILTGDFTDKDGDGDRDGSAEDQRQQREEKKKNSLWEQFMTGYKEGKDKKITKEGMMGGLKSLLGGVMTLLGPVGRVLMTLKNVMVGGITLIAKGVGMAVRVMNALKGVPALLGRGIGMAKNAIGAVVNNPFTRAVARGGARVLGAVIGGPVRAAVLGGIAIADWATGGAISGAAKVAVNTVYDYFKGKSSVIAKFRMAQYGYDIDDEDNADKIKKLIELENLVAPYTTVDNYGQASFSTGLKAEAALQIFKVDGKNEEQVGKWVEWFVKRFKPVYLAHAAAQYEAIGKVNVSQADNNVPVVKKVAYLNRIHFLGDDTPYTVKASPFPEDDEVEMTNGWLSDSVDNLYEDVLRWAKDNAANANLEKQRKLAEAGKKPETKPDPTTLWGKTQNYANKMKENLGWAFNHATKDFNVLGTNKSLQEWGGSLGSAAFDQTEKLGKMWSDYKNKIDYEPGGDRKKNFMAVMEAARRAGDPHPEIVAAQWALESDWGKKQSGKYNFFGIKAKPNEKGSTVTTHEVYGGQRKKIQDRFKDYGSIEEGILDRVMFMVKNPRYINAGYFNAKTPFEAAVALRRGEYASDDKYVGVLASVLKGAGIDPNMPSSGDPSKIINLRAENKIAIKPNTPATANTMVKPVLANANTPSQPQGTTPTVVAPMVTPVSYTPPNGSAAPISAASYNTPAINTNPPEDFSLYKGEQKYIELGKKAYRLEEGVDFRLDPAFAQRVYAAFGEYFEKTKKMVTVTSCYRSREKQAKLYKEFLARNRRPPAVAAPGKSKHEVGLAIDISSVQGNEMEKMGILRKNGIIRPLANHKKYPEPWHLEMASKEPTKPEESDTMNYISPISQPEVTPLTTSGTPAPVENKTASATNVEPVLPQTPEVVTTKPAVYSAPVITNPADKMVVQTRDDESQKKALAEAQKAAKAVEGAKGIDGAVEILRQQHRIQEQMRDSLVDLGQTALRLEQVLLALANNVGSQQTPQQPNVVRPNIKTATDTRPAPVSVSRQT